MLSLALAPVRLEKFSIKCHFRSWYFFGIMPKWLTWRLGNRGVRKGPTTLPFFSLFSRYSSMTAGWSRAEGTFLGEVQRVTRWGWKPWWKPERTKFTLRWSGWLTNSASNLPTQIGDTWAGQHRGEILHPATEETHDSWSPHKKSHGDLVEQELLFTPCTECELGEPKHFSPVGDSDVFLCPTLATCWIFHLFLFLLRA